MLKYLNLQTFVSWNLSLFRIYALEFWDIHAEKCWLSKRRRETKTDVRVQGGQLMPNIKRRDKRRNNSATFNKQNYGIGWAVGFNQVPGSLGLRVYASGAFGRSCARIYVPGHELNPTSIMMNHNHRTYCYCCHRIFIFIPTSTLFPIFSPWVSNRVILQWILLQKYILFVLYDI